MIDKDFEKMFFGKFRIESNLIKLVGRVEGSIELSGSGFIERNDQGVIILTLFSPEYDRAKYQEYTKKSQKPGVIGDDRSFDLQFFDMNNNEWVAESLVVHSPFIFARHGNVFKCKINDLFCICRHESNASFYMFFIDKKYKIPVNKYEMKNNGFSLNHREAEFQDIKVKILQLEDYYTVEVFSKDGRCSIDTAHLVLEAMSVAFGSIVKAFAGYFIFGGRVEQHIYKAHDVFSVSPALDINSFPGKKGFDFFLERYVVTHKEKNSYIYATCCNMYQSYKANFVIFATQICIGLEGISKQYLKEYGMPCEENIQFITAARNALSESKEFSDRAKNIMAGALANSLSFRAKTLLHFLKEKSVVSDKEISSWTSIRNKMLHSDKLKNSESEYNKIILDAFNCLSIFYKIIFIAIGYSGDYINYLNLEDDVSWFDNPFVEKVDTSSLMETFKPFILERFLAKN